jgi:hypothetical protein
MTMNHHWPAAALIRSALLMGLVELLPLVSAAADWWVDAGTAAGGDGSAARPLRTIQAAAALAQPGDTVRVRPGIYRERVMPPRGGEPGRPIRYVSEVRHGAVVKGSDEWKPAWRDEGGGVYSGSLDDVRFDDTAYVDGGNPYRIAFYWDQARQLPPYPFTSVTWTLGQVFLDGTPVREASARQVLNRGGPAWWYDAAGNRIFLRVGARLPDGRLVELTTRRGVFRPQEKGLGHLEVRGFVFEHCADQFPEQFWRLPENALSGMVGTRGGHHWIIADNIIRHAKCVGLNFGASGVTAAGRPAFDNEVPARLDPLREQSGFHQIIDNLFFANGAIGAIGSGHTGVVFERNVFLGNNALGNTAYETGGIKTIFAYGMRIEANWFLDNECMGLWLDNTWRACRVTRNVFAGNRGWGLFLEMDHNTPETASLVDRNLFLDGRPDLVSASKAPPGTVQKWRPWAAGIYGHDADGVRIIQNLFSGEGYGLYFRKISDRKGGAANIEALGNLFIGERLIPVCVPIENPPAVRGNSFDGNVYPPSAAEPRFVLTGWSTDPKTGVDRAGLDRILAATAGAGSPPPRFGDPAKPPAGYFVNFNQWRTLTGSDAHSAAVALACSLDRATWTLTIDVPPDAAPVPPAAQPTMQEDFLGRSVPARRGVGPFGLFAPGKHQFKLPNPRLSPGLEPVELIPFP